MKQTCKLPSGTVQSPAAKQFLVHYEVKNCISSLLHWIFFGPERERL